MHKHAIILLLSIMLSVVPSALAQDGAAVDGITQPDVEIFWPPPVTEVWGIGDIIGTAAVNGMSYYYLEYLPLNSDFSSPASAPWIPLTVAIEEPVVNGKLATLDTTTVPDGLYALRLVVNTVEGETYFDVVQPVRVSNERYAGILERIVESTLTGIGELLAEDGINLEDYLVTEDPDEQPQVDDTTPRAVPAPGYTSVNVRRCDSIDNYACAIVGTLTTTGAAVTAVSSNGTGWYQVALPTGHVGWVSPNVTVISGNVNSLPRVRPPEPLPPPATANITLNGISTQTAPTCAETFNVQVNVANVGNAVSQEGTLTLQDVNIRTGDVTFTGYGRYPAINPGGNFVVVIPVTIDTYFNESHELRAYIGEQRISYQYVLQEGNCNAGAPPPTQPPPPPTNQRDFAAGQCFLVLENPKLVFDTPYGNPQGTIDPGPYEANQVRESNGLLWYRANIDPLGSVWMDGTILEKQGNCSL